MTTDEEQAMQVAADHAASACKTLHPPISLKLTDPHAYAMQNLAWQRAMSKSMSAHMMTASRAKHEAEMATLKPAKHGFMIYRSSRSTVNDGYLDGAARNVGNFLGSVGGWICAFLLFILAITVLQAAASIF